MKSPLEFDTKTVKDFDITNDVEPEFKLNFARAQKDEIQKALWRERIDLMIAQYQVDTADDDNVKTQHQAKVNEKKMLIKQFVRSVSVLTVLVSELEQSLSN